jgi:UDP-3-O-[3-hydroxymyristoyl] glucosamine N-acyltransferase
MKISLKDIAGFIGGEITGDEKLEVKNLARIEEALPGDLTFLYLSHYEKYFPSTKASAILVKPGFNKSRDDISYVEVSDPNKAFFKLVRKFFLPSYPLEGIDETTFIHPDADVGENFSAGKNVVISEGCRIGNNVKIFHNTVLLQNVEIGDDCLVFQNVSIRENCKIGNRVIIHPGTVIGSDGFGFEPDDKGKFIKIPQIGNVIVEDDVELGSNVSVDRASIGSTIIKRGVKIDNLVQIAHNVYIGDDTVISDQAGISGSTKVGKNCFILGQVGLTGHIDIADNVILIAQSGVSKSITKAGTYFGSPAKEVKTAYKLESHIRNLPDYAKKISELEGEIKSLREKIDKKTFKDSDRK